MTGQHANVTAPRPALRIHTQRASATECPPCQRSTWEHRSHTMPPLTGPHRQVDKIQWLMLVFVLIMLMQYGSAAQPGLLGPFGFLWSSCSTPRAVCFPQTARANCSGGGHRAAAPWGEQFARAVCSGGRSSLLGGGSSLLERGGREDRFRVLDVRTSTLGFM